VVPPPAPEPLAGPVLEGWPLLATVVALIGVGLIVGGLVGWWLL
jgi:hypothetical protein